jgi:phenylacetic acid degradation operon negative regulatory protein
VLTISLPIRRQGNGFAVRWTPGETGNVDARSALFDLYGDHLRSRGSRAPVAALVRMLAPLGITAPAVRTAVSRMARQGWLEAVRLPEGAGYELTPRAVRRLDEAAERIYRHGDPGWDGRWHLVVVERIRERAGRERLRSALGYLGYAPIDDTTWLSPRPSRELEALLETERVRAERFAASYDGDVRGLVARAWDLEGLSHAYLRWLAVAADLVASVGPDTPDEVVFASRSRLVHEWRKFLFRDPGLPAELLPAQWTGRQAAEVFDTESARLLPAASRFVDSCLRPGTASYPDRPAPTCLDG